MLPDGNVEWNMNTISEINAKISIYETLFSLTDKHVQRLAFLVLKDLSRRMIANLYIKKNIRLIVLTSPLILFGLDQLKYDVFLRKCFKRLPIYMLKYIFIDMSSHAHGRKREFYEIPNEFYDLVSLLIYIHHHFQQDLDSFLPYHLRNRIRSWLKEYK